MNLRGCRASAPPATTRDPVCERRDAWTRKSTGEPGRHDDDAASTVVRVDGVDGIDRKLPLPHGFFPPGLTICHARQVLLKFLALACPLKAACGRSLRHTAWSRRVSPDDVLDVQLFQQLPAIAVFRFRL